MSVHVADSVLWSAVTDRLPGAWADLARWAAERPSDPTPGRAATLRELLDLPPGPDAEALAAAGRSLCGPGAPHGLLQRCVAWHDEDVANAAPLMGLFAGHGPGARTTTQETDPQTWHAIAGWLARRLGPDLRLTSLDVLSGGYSRRMLAAAWSGPDGPGRGIVRVEQGGMFGTDGAREAAVLTILRDAGHAVPAVLGVEPDPAVLGQPFFVMEHVPGEPAHGEESLDDVLRATQALHDLPAAAVRAVGALDGLDPSWVPSLAVAAQTEHWYRCYRTAAPQPIPLLERAFGWLAENLLPTGPSVVVHGDAGPGNALHDGRRVTAVVDWEFAHVGDAAEEWAYLALVRGRKLLDPPAWKQRLRQVVGVEHDEATWRAWEAFVCVKGACVNLTALDVFARSATPAPEHLAIGVAVHLRFLDRVLELTGARS